MKKINLLSIFIISLFVFSCNNTKDFSEYASLKNKNLSGETLLVELIKFETEHSNHFESKVDLASFYALVGNYTKAYEYCIRAESVIKNAPKNKDGKKAICILNGTRAKVDYYRGDFDSAMEFCNTALKDKANGQVFANLKGQILVSMNKLDEALEVFDKAYTEAPENATSEDLKSYMYLLATHDRLDKAKLILEKYFETGNYFSEFGAFASSVYEKTNHFDLSLLSTFYDYLFYSNFIPEAEKKYFSNLDTLREALKKSGQFLSYEDAINYVESYFTLDEKVTLNSDFFISQFIAIHKRIENKTVTQDDLQALLKMEKHFSLFPCFYWNVYKALMIALPSAQDVPAVLEKVLSLNNKNIYMDAARTELGKYIGLSEKDSKSLLIATEVDKVIKNYQKSLNIDELNPLFDLLEMPENTYELQTLVYLKMEYKNLGLASAFLKKRELCSNKLGERIDYILN